MAPDTDKQLLQNIVEQALQQADGEHAERVTIRVGVLRALWDGFEARGLALRPFAELAGDLGPGDEDEKPVAVRVTCSDLRAARTAQGYP